MDRDLLDKLIYQPPKWPRRIQILVDKKKLHHSYPQTLLHTMIPFLHQTPVKEAAEKLIFEHPPMTYTQKEALQNLTLLMNQNFLSDVWAVCCDLCKCYKSFASHV